MIKMKFEEETQYNDFKGCIALHHDYITCEPLIEGRAYDLRIQKNWNS